MGNLISISVYRIEPKIGTTPVVLETYQKGLPPFEITSIEDIPAATRIATALPRIYGRVITNEGGVQKEYLVAETVAQVLAKGNAALS